MDNLVQEVILAQVIGNDEIKSNKTRMLYIISWLKDLYKM